MKVFSKGSWIILLTLFVLGSAIGFGAPVDETAKDKLTEITEEEKGIVEALFVLSSEIELLNTELSQLSVQMTDIKDQIAASEASIIKLEAQYKQYKDSLAEVLRLQQRSGVASRVEALLNAKNLKDFIKRINILRDLSRNVDALMATVEGARIDVEREKEALEELLVALIDKEALVKQATEEKTKAKNELEAYLESLASEREHYESYLESITQVWSSLKPMFSKTIAAFTDIIETGNLPEDTVEVNVSLFNTRGTIWEDKFNQILSQKKELPELTFDFIKDGAKLNFPDYEITLIGQFELLDEQTIKYVVTGGEFYGLPMTQDSIKDLFSEGDLVFSLQSLLGKNTLRRIDHFEDRLELAVIIKLF